MKYFYYEVEHNVSLTKLLNEKNNDIIYSKQKYNFRALAGMLSLLFFEIPFPALILFHCDYSVIIHDRCLFHTIRDFYNNHIPLRHSLLNDSIKSKYQIDRDMFYYELPEDFSVIFQNATITTLNVYGENSELEEVLGYFDAFLDNAAM